MDVFSVIGISIKSVRVEVIFSAGNLSDLHFSIYPMQDGNNLKKVFYVSSVHFLKQILYIYVSKN